MNDRWGIGTFFRLGSLAPESEPPVSFRIFSIFEKRGHGRFHSLEMLMISREDYFDHENKEHWHVNIQIDVQNGEISFFLF